MLVSKSLLKGHLSTVFLPHGDVGAFTFGEIMCYIPSHRSNVACLAWLKAKSVKNLAKILLPDSTSLSGCHSSSPTAFITHAPILRTGMSKAVERMLMTLMLALATAGASSRRALSSFAVIPSQSSSSSSSPLERLLTPSHVASSVGAF